MQAREPMVQGQKAQTNAEGAAVGRGDHCSGYWMETAD